MASKVLEFDLTKDGVEVAQYTELEHRILGRLYLNKTAAHLLFGRTPTHVTITISAPDE